MRHTGHYSDGRRAERHQVEVQADRTALRLYRPGGEALDAWPYAGLYTAETVYGDGPVRLRHRQRGEALLTLPTARLLAQVEAQGGPRLRGRRLLRPSLALAAVAAVLTLGALATVLWLVPAALAPLARWVPPAWERALGERVLAQLAAQHPVCRDAAGDAALAALARRLADPAALPAALEVHVLADPGVNAFALPGGRVVLLRGLLDAARNPEELAGVLAHEIAHVAERHPLQGLIRSAGSALLLRALLGDGSTLDAAAARFAQFLVLARYSREDERAADAEGVRLLNAADIRGAPLAAFLRRLAASGGGAPPALLSTHPLTAGRAERIEQAARGQGPALTPAQWRALQGVCG